MVQEPSADPVPQPFPRGALIGKTTRIHANIEGGEDLRVQGRVEGKIRLSETLLIAQEGEVAADVNVKIAIVSGVMMGNIQATEFVRIAETGRMVGDIVAPRVILVDGAAFRGRIDMGEFEAAKP